MKRTSLWTGRSVGLIVSALGLAAVAAGTVLMTQAAVGQAAGEEDHPQLSRREVSELLVAAREAMREGRLDDAEKAVARAEAAGIEYPLFYRGDTPKRVRKALKDARDATDRSPRPALPNPLSALMRRTPEPATDPFAGRDRTMPAGEHDGTAIPSPNSYPTTYPDHVTMPTPPPIDVPFGASQGRYADTGAAQHSVAVGGDTPESHLQGHLPPALSALPPVESGSGSPQTSADPAALAASQAALRSARLALAVGDTRLARQHLASAKSLGANHPPGHDRPAAVEAAIVRLDEIMADRNALAGDPAWRRQYGTILCEQAAALVDYRAFDEAERLVADAARLGVSYGPYDINPQQVMQKIAQARQGTTAQPATGTLAGQSSAPAPLANAIVPPVQPTGPKEHALRLVAAARAAMAAGDIRQAEALVAQADALRVPAEQFAAGEDHPNMAMIDIQKAKMARAQREAELSSGALATQRPQLDLQVQQTLYTPHTDQSVIQPAAGMQLDLTPPDPAPQGPAPALLASEEALPVQSEAARLLSQGEAALRDGNAQSALQFFRDAYAQRGDLDPVDVQRLQGHLQMLSVAGPPQPPLDGGGSLIDAANQSEQVLVRQLSAELTRLQTEARRLRETDPKRALAVLQEARETIVKSNLSQAVKAQLLRRVELSVRDTDDYITQNRAQLELDAKNQEVLQEVERRRQAKLAMQGRIAELVDQFNTLQDEQRYDEMEIVAQRLHELAPEEPVAQMAWSTAKAYRRSKLNDMLQAEKEDAVWTALNTVETSLMPFDDNNPFQFSDAHTWEEMTRSRYEQRARRNRLNERELEIQRKLRMPVQVDYPDTPLQDVMNDLGRITGITIHLDQYGLAQENVRTDQPVRLSVQSEISLQSVLDLILEPLHLDYVIQSEVLKITSQQRAQGATYPMTYDVADLVIPIPNFVPSNNTGLQGLINDAHMTAAGQWLTGPSPVVTVANDRTKGGKTYASEVLAQQGMSGPSSLNTPAVPMTSGPGPLGGGAAADFESLISLITTTVHAESWDFNGGPGSIKEFATNLSLVISQTQEVHEEIADLLEQLRRLQDLQVTIEVRFITLSDNFFEQIGVDFDFLVEDGPGVIPELRPDNVAGTPAPGQRIEGRHRSATVGLLPSTLLTDFPNFTSDLDIPFRQDSFNLVAPQFGTPVTVAEFGFAILSELEAYFVVQAAQGDRRSNVLEAPKVTLFNGQNAFVQDTSSRPFVTSVVPVVGDFAAAQQPVIVVLSEGTMLSIQAVVSEDRRYVRLTVVPFFTQIGDVEEFTFEGSTTTTTGSSSMDDDDDGNNEEESSNSNTVRSGTTVQLPTFSQISVSTTVSVPDGGTVLLGGIKRLREGRNEFGVPLLSKIPYVNRLFRNVGIGRETQSLMMMVTPRIIIQEEEEQRLLGTLP